MSLTQYIKCYDDVISQDLCDKLINNNSNLESSETLYELENRLNFINKHEYIS